MGVKSVRTKSHIFPHFPHIFPKIQVEDSRYVNLQPAGSVRKIWFVVVDATYCKILDEAGSAEVPERYDLYCSEIKVEKRTLKS